MIHTLKRIDINNLNMQTISIYPQNRVFPDLPGFKDSEYQAAPCPQGHCQTSLQFLHLPQS